MKDQATQAIQRSHQARHALKNFEQTLIKLEHILNQLKLPHACVAGELGSATIYIKQHVITVTIDDLFQGVNPKLKMRYYQNLNGDLVDEKNLSLSAIQTLLLQIE